MKFFKRVFGGKPEPQRIHAATPAEEAPRPAKPTPTTLPELLADLRSPEFDTWWNARNALRNMKTPETRDAMIPLLRDPAFGIRASAAEILLSIGWEPASNIDKAICALALGQFALNNEIVQFHHEMEKLGTEVIEPLVNAVDTAGDWRKARAAVGALAFMGTEAVLPALYNIVRTFRLNHKYDTGDCQRAAAEAIGKIRNRGNLQGPRAGWEPRQDQLVSARTAADLAPGDYIRIWHDILNRWATGWLKVIEIIDDLIVLEDVESGEFKVRAVSDSVPCQKCPSGASETVGAPASQVVMNKTDKIEISTMSDIEMLKELEKLCEAYARDDRQAIKDLEPLATGIGETLDQRGGIEEMRRVFEMLGPIRGARTLDMHWGGIGEWRG